MKHDATLHVKLTEDTDKNLKKLSYDSGKSKGQLVREAIAACYQSSMENLPLSQQHALHAYQGGFISLGKLAQEMGMHAIQMRQWLHSRGIAQQNSVEADETLHA